MLEKGEVRFAGAGSGGGMSTAGEGNTFDEEAGAAMGVMIKGELYCNKLNEVTGSELPVALLLITSTGSILVGTFETLAL